jgi:hypothetical protein
MCCEENRRSGSLSAISTVWFLPPSTNNAVNFLCRMTTTKNITAGADLIETVSYGASAVLARGRARASGCQSKRVYRRPNANGGK